MSARRVLLVSHVRRDEALHATLETARLLLSEGIHPVMEDSERDALAQWAASQGVQEQVVGVGVLSKDCHVADLELAIVLGGDGTILKAAEMVRDSNTPLLGINLGHVGFLAESERDELHASVKRVVARDYVIRERLTLDVTVEVEGKVVYSTWALNECSVEKSAAEKMIEVLIEVDERPLSSFGADGVVMSTPTGSTAYAFSAGGPVVWPGVEALLLVPLSAHALFSRPLVIAPNSLMAVEVSQSSNGNGVLWCDGRRTTALPRGARVEVRRSEQSVRLARFRNSAFTDRLVAKFSLPVTGWRGAAREHDEVL
ncbi:MAG: NAD kinase [Micrococcales bacterium]